MKSQSNLYRLQGVVQHYNWGGKDFLPALLGVKNTESTAFAEFWMGAHSNGPSVLLDKDSKSITLDEFIRQAPEERLGRQVYRQFGRLPYLFKVLDVKDMLSIQVHPNLEAARREFAEEERRGVPLQATHRNYKDDNHKPELMVALSEFWLLHGFKEPAAMENILQQVPELRFLADTWKSQSYPGIYRLVMEMDQPEVNTRLQPLIDRIVPLYEQHLLNKSSEDFWAARAFGTFCKDGVIDRGIFSIYLFNLVHMKKGQAIFQDAGILHAYLEGQNLEIMANSDNVLRGGLTNKHVDVPELMKHVRFEPTVPKILSPVTTGPEKVFETPAKDFELRELEFKKGGTSTLRTSTTDIFLVYQGAIRARSGDDELLAERGSCFLLPAGKNLEITADEPALVFHATVPFSQG